MCGRYTLTTPAELIGKAFEIPEVPELEPRYNIAPTQIVPAVRAVRGEERRAPGERAGEVSLTSRPKRELCFYRWGLIPFFARDVSIGARMINARAETAPEKPAFRQAVKFRRCIVPATGFLEWKTEGKNKYPYYYRGKDDGPLGFAGLYERWTSPDGERIESCTILTTEPNELVEPLHDRMPVILRDEDYDLWLDRREHRWEPLLDLMRPYPADRMRVDPVSRRVNNVRNDDPACLAPPDET